jgi:hypothetical protein
VAVGLQAAGEKTMRGSGRMHVYVGAPSRRSQVARVAVTSRSLVGRDQYEGVVVLWGRRGRPAVTDQ